MDNPLSLNLYTYVHNNPLIYADPTGHWCTSSDGKWSHPGGCNDGVSGQERFGGEGYSPDYANGNRDIIENNNIVGFYLYGFGSVRFGVNYELGVRGWTFRYDRAHEPTTGKRHIHIMGPNKQEWSQNEDGSPHDGSSGSPPNSMKKEVFKKTGWDWDAKAKTYQEREDATQFAYVPNESEIYYFSNANDYMKFKSMYEIGMAGEYRGGVIVVINGVQTTLPNGFSGTTIRIPRLAIP